MYRLIPRLLCASLPAALLLTSCATGPTADDTDQAQPADQAQQQQQTPSPRFGTFGFDVDGMNTDIAPGDDFYAFANGTWDDTTEIPSDRSRYGMFDKLSLEAEEDVHDIITDFVDEGGEPGSNQRLVGDFYTSWMDEETIEAVGLEPAEPYLERITGTEDIDDAAALMAEVGMPAPYGVRISPDPKDPSVYAVRTGQSGLGMPDRDYYLDDSQRFEEYRDAYRDYIVEIHELAGIDDPERRADDIIDLETRLADAHWPRERSRQITETYNVMTVDEFAELAPSLHLDKALKIRGFEDLDELIVAQPDAIEAAGEIFADAHIDTIHDYLRFHFLSDRASWLGEEFDRAHFHFFSHTLSGTEEQRERYRRGTRLISRHLGHAVGPEYVERHFPPDAREQMDELVDNLLDGFERRLTRLDWMDDETREAALEKLSTFESRIGYPEIWESFEDVEIHDDDYFGNRMRLAEHRWQRDLQRFGEPVDRRRWHWPPQMVNASYNSLLNQITFPAGILQAPFFDPEADPAINYGAIGAVIGHEIGHGFDDQGRRYDAEGQLRDWWTDTTDEQFEKASGALVEQYNQFCPFEDQCVNGRLALGENIGDLGGMQMAYDAYRSYADENYPDGEPPEIDGLSGDQRFFLGWAQIWRSLYRDDALRSRLVNGPHAPGRFRVNGVVRNIDAFYDAFDVDENHELYLPPDERVSIW